jgi:hypothetical protein
MLEKRSQRMRNLQRIVDTITAFGGPEATVAKAADLINLHAIRNGDITLSEWGTIFWAAPSREVDRLTAQCNDTLGAPTNAQIARHLRDALGLVHLDFDRLDDGRRIFIMRG